MAKYIDANSFLEYEENRCKNYPPLIGTCSFDNADLREELVNFPAADVEPVRHGYWDDSFDGITPYCSVCRMSHRCLMRTPDYCPNCGAKMDGENSE